MWAHALVPTPGQFTSLAQAIYSAVGQGSAECSTQLSNQASLPMFAPSGSLADYPYHCFIPIPYPIFTIVQFQSTPLHALAMQLARSRGTLDIAHADHLYRLLQNAASTRPKGVNSFRAVMLYNKDANKTLIMSNMSVARIVDIDWSGITRVEKGKVAGETVCRYKKLFTDSAVQIQIGNLVTIARKA